MLTPEYLCTVSDALARARLDSTAHTAFLECAALIEESVWDSRSQAIHAKMLVASQRLKTAGHPDHMHRNFLGPLVVGLEQLAMARRTDGYLFRNLPSFLRHFNTGSGGPWRALVHPTFAELYELQYPGRVNEATGIRAADIYADGSAQLIKGEGGVDATMGSGFARLSINCVNANSTDPGTVTVTGVARTNSGIGSVVAPNRTWSARGVLLNDDSTYWLQPDNAGDLCIEVTDITLPGGFKSGEVQIWGHGPEGRL